jgi:hypothetical protein
MTAAQDFGKELRHARGPVSQIDLAICMASQGSFHHSSLRDAADLANRIDHIEAGRSWPFDQGDFYPFVLAAAGCLPDRPKTALWLTAAVYFLDL